MSETAGIARTAEVVRSGVPLARDWNITAVEGLAIVDGDGMPVPAEFQVLARWHAGRDDVSAPIQWLLVTFPTTVAAHDSATYRLVTDGSAGPNPLPATTVSLTRDGDQITVDTGAATFVLGGDSGALFDEIRLADGTQLVSGSILTATVNGVELDHPVTRRVHVEHAGPLTAIVVVEGAYDMAPVGGGGLGSSRRYVFTAGSPTAIVRQAVHWEGSVCPGRGYNLTCNGTINGVLVTRVRDALALSLDAPLTVTAIGAFDEAALQGEVSGGQEAWVRQGLRDSRTAPLSFDVNLPGAPGASGQKADGGLLAVSSDAGAVAIALNHMHRYEPQALRLLNDGRLAVDLADDRAWLGQRQGLFATFAVSALPANPARPDLEQRVWAPLNRPLRAWPTAEWFAAADAVDELPVGALPDELAEYDSLVEGVLTRTRQEIDARGLAGLMTFGHYPRTWASPLLSDEIDCFDDEDPTPGQAWDDPYWCATWTDYHNTIVTAPIWAMRSGQVAWLDEIAFPGALRMLHTQIMQCAPDDPWFYCGQSPAGYGGYRLDFNSSHAYLDNLFLYYWLTGDYTVVETLERGASSMRDYLCSRRPAASCLPDDPPDDFWAQLTGRTAMQWFAVFRFVGLAGDDVSHLEDYQDGLARAVTQHYVEAEQEGKPYGFWLYGGDPVTGPGTYTTDQLWMVSLYDMNLLYRLHVDTDDAPIGNPAIPPSQVLAAWARTLTDFGATVSGDGTAAGVWPNELNFTWSGSRIGGTLHSVTPYTEGGDPFLYDTGKATLTATLLRAAQRTGEAALQEMGADLTALALNAALNDDSPLSKEQGLYLARLHAAVARLATTLTSTETPTPTATPTPPGAATPTPTADNGTPTVTPTPTPTATPTPTRLSAPGVLLHTTLDDAAAITSPVVGIGGASTLLPADFVSGRVGNGAQFVREGQDCEAADYQLVTFPVASGNARNIKLDRGALEFWYRPNYDAAEPDGTHTLIEVGIDGYNPPSLVLELHDEFSLSVVEADWTWHGTVTDYRAPLWAGGEWVHMRATWDNSHLTDSLRLYLNDTRVDNGGVPGGWDLGSENENLNIIVGSGTLCGDFIANGIIDELIIYDAPQTATTPTPTPTPTPTSTPSADIPAHCAPEVDGDGFVTVLDIQARAADVQCVAYLPLIASYWRQSWPPVTATPTSTPTPTSTGIPTPTPTPTPTATAPAPVTSFSYHLFDDQFRHGQGVVVVDIDGDGDQDVIAAISLTDAVYLYLNGGDSMGGGDGGTWSRVPIAPEGSIVAMQVAVADFNQDGALDVAAVGLFDRDCTFCAPGEVAWYANPGDVTEPWTAHGIVTDLWGARYIAAADMTGDGLPDLVVSAIEVDGQGNGVYWFRNVNNGSSWVGPTPIDADLLGVETVLVHDVDGDGVLDVIAVGANSNEVAWYKNERTAGVVENNPAFTKHVIATPDAPYGLALADLDGDGTLELIVTSGNGVTWYDPPADPANPWTEHTIDAEFGNYANARLFAADLDGDGRVDVAVSSNSGELRWYRNHGDGSWTANTITSGYTGLTFLTGGDINGDGRMDLVTSTYENTSENDEIAWWRNEP